MASSQRHLHLVPAPAERTPARTLKGDVRSVFAALRRPGVRRGAGIAAGVGALLAAALGRGAIADEHASQLPVRTVDSSTADPAQVYLGRVENVHAPEPSDISSITESRAQSADALRAQIASDRATAVAKGEAVTAHDRATSSADRGTQR